MKIRRHTEPTDLQPSKPSMLPASCTLWWVLCVLIGVCVPYCSCSCRCVP